MKITKKTLFFIILFGNLCKICITTSNPNKCYIKEETNKNKRSIMNHFLETNIKLISIKKQKVDQDCNIIESKDFFKRNRQTTDTSYHDQKYQPIPLGFTKKQEISEIEGIKKVNLELKNKNLQKCNDNTQNFYRISDYVHGDYDKLKNNDELMPVETIRSLKDLEKDEKRNIDLFSEELPRSPFNLYTINRVGFDPGSSIHIKNHDKNIIKSEFNSKTSLLSFEMVKIPNENKKKSQGIEENTKNIKQNTSISKETEFPNIKQDTEIIDILNNLNSKGASINQINMIFSKTKEIIKKKLNINKITEVKIEKCEKIDSHHKSEHVLHNTTENANKKNHEFNLKEERRFKKFETLYEFKNNIYEILHFFFDLNEEGNFFLKNEFYILIILFPEYAIVLEELKSYIFDEEKMNYLYNRSNIFSLLDKEKFLIFYYTIVQEGLMKMTEITKENEKLETILFIYNLYKFKISLAGIPYIKNKLADIAQQIFDSRNIQLYRQFITSGLVSSHSINSVSNISFYIFILLDFQELYELGFAEFMSVNFDQINKSSGDIKNNRSACEKVEVKCKKIFTEPKTNKGIFEEYNNQKNTEIEVNTIITKYNCKKLTLNTYMYLNFKKIGVCSKILPKMINNLNISLKKVLGLEMAKYELNFELNHQIVIKKTQPYVCYQKLNNKIHFDMEKYLEEEKILKNTNKDFLFANLRTLKNDLCSDKYLYISHKKFIEINFNIFLQAYVKIFIMSLKKKE